MTAWAEAQPLMATNKTNSSATVAASALAISLAVMGTFIYSSTGPSAATYTYAQGITTTRPAGLTASQQVLPQRTALMARKATEEYAPPPQFEQPAAEGASQEETTAQAAGSPVLDALKIPAVLAMTLLAVVKGLSAGKTQKAKVGQMDMFQAMESDAIRSNIIPRGVATTAVAAAVSVAAATGTLADPANAFGTPSNQDVYKEAWKAVATTFIDTSFNGLDWNQVKTDALAKEYATREAVYDQIRSDLDLLGDPFTRLLDPVQYNNIRRRLTGRLTGAGLEIAPDANKKLVVQDRVPGGPADKNGILDGDYILAVDGEDVGEQTQFDIAEKLVGNKNSTLTLRVQTPGSEPRDVSFKRETITFQAVKSGICESVVNQTTTEGKDISKLGYIRVPSFNFSTAAEFNKALDSVTEDGAEGVVLDLRGNTGGSLNAAYEMANSVLPQGEIVRVIGADGKVTSAQVRGRPAHPDVPLSLLVNRRTASSSEVLSAALKTAGRATIAGNQTFGKGIIQDIKTLPDGSALFVTKERYLTPTSEEIDRVGITPTVAVDPKYLDLKTGLPTEPPQFCEAMSKDAPSLFSGTAPPFDPEHPELDLATLSAFG